MAEKAEPGNVVVVAAQPLEMAEPLPPESHLGLSIFSCLCCNCCCLGVVALIFSIMSNSDLKAGNVRHRLISYEVIYSQWHRLISYDIIHQHCSISFAFIYRLLDIIYNRISPENKLTEELPLQVWTDR